MTQSVLGRLRVLSGAFSLDQRGHAPPPPSSVVLDRLSEEDVDRGEVHAEFLHEASR